MIKDNVYIACDFYSEMLWLRLCKFIISSTPHIQYNNCTVVCKYVFVYDNNFYSDFGFNTLNERRSLLSYFRRMLSTQDQSHFAVWPAKINSNSMNANRE